MRLVVWFKLGFTLQNTRSDMSHPYSRQAEREGGGGAITPTFLHKKLRPKGLVGLTKAGAKDGGLLVFQSNLLRKCQYYKLLSPPLRILPVESNQFFVSRRSI